MGTKANKKAAPVDDAADDLLGGSGDAAPVGDADDLLGGSDAAPKAKAKGKAKAAKPAAKGAKPAAKAAKPVASKVPAKPAAKTAKGKAAPAEKPAKAAKPKAAKASGAGSKGAKGTGKFYIAAEELTALQKKIAAVKKAQTSKELAERFTVPTWQARTAAAALAKEGKGSLAKVGALVVYTPG